MLRTHRSRATTLGLLLLAVASPLAAQQSTNDLFRAFLPGSGAAVALGPLEETERSEGGTSVGTSGGWFDEQRTYIVAGSAALAGGLLLAQRSGTGSPAIGGSVTELTSAGATAGAADPMVLVNPEPGTVLLLGTGLAGVAMIARRRRAT